MTYTWLDNPTLSGIAQCDTDVLNDCLMHLKYESAASRNIGEIVASTIPLTDAGLQLLDGSLKSGSGSYAAFVDYIGDLYDSGDYDDIFETEANWQQSITDYGVCGKFVYDSVNNTVRLPKITGFTESTVDPTVVGDLTEAGLPNITGSFSRNNNATGFNAGSGAFSGSDWGSVDNGEPTGSGNRSMSFDASRSSSIYGNSTTVQPQSVKVLFYIVIATTTKTDIQVDIDEITTDLNGKADVDLSNMNASQSAKTEITNWCVPDYQSAIVGLTFPYTVPTTGIIKFAFNSNTASYAIIQNLSPQGRTGSKLSGNWIIQDLWVRTGDVVTLSGSATVSECCFIPMKGVS